ncbi:AEC family transporter [Martelella limonii]|uniref:AEC family transporter n=1 Tax=Martelella limonii TaxID=1647649 RepID=UPI0015810382|nr:AEC family transporter [Martelella limonii]
MQQIFDSVIPIFALILIGWIAVKTRYLPENHAGVLSAFVYRVGLPVLLMRTIANADFTGTDPLSIWAVYFSSIAIAWIVASLTARFGFRRDRLSAVVIGLSGTFSNLALLGVPLISHVAGDRALVAISVVLAIHMPVLMVTATVLAERAKAREGGIVSAPGKLATTVGYNLATNPLVIGLIIGGIMNFTGVEPAAPLAAIISMLAGIAAPVALVSIGMTLAQYKVAGNAGLFSAITVIKLALLPGLVYALSHLFGLPQPVMAGLVLGASCPAGVNAFLLADQFGTGRNIAASTITLTTILGVVTVSLWVLLLGY